MPTATGDTSGVSGTADQTVTLVTRPWVGKPDGIAGASGRNVTTVTRAVAGPSDSDSEDATEGEDTTSSDSSLSVGGGLEIS